MYRENLLYWTVVLLWIGFSVLVSCVILDPRTEERFYSIQTQKGELQLCWISRRTPIVAQRGDVRVLWPRSSEGDDLGQILMDTPAAGDSKVLLSRSANGKNKELFEHHREHWIGAEPE